VRSLRSLFRKLRSALKRRPVVVRSWELLLIDDILRRKLTDVKQVHDFRFFWEIRLTDKNMMEARKLMAAHDFDALKNYSGGDTAPGEYPREYLILASFRNQTGNLFFALIYDSDLLEQDAELFLYEPA